MGGPGGKGTETVSPESIIKLLKKNRYVRITVIKRLFIDLIC